MKVGILGTPVSAGNRGVRALAASLVSLCIGSGCQEVVLFVGHYEAGRLPFQIGNQTLEVRVVNHRLSPRARMKEHLAWILFASLLYRLLPLARVRQWLAQHTPWIVALREMDVVGDIRGGDSFSDLYGWRRFLLGFLVAWTVILVKGELVQFPQTYGPFQRAWTRWLGQYLLKRSRVIVARDRESQWVAQQLVGPTKYVWLSPDVAFALEVEVPSRLETDPPLNLSVLTGAKLGTPPIGLNVNGLMYNGGYTRDNMFGLKLDYGALLPRLAATLLEEYPGELWLIPHTYAPAQSVESDQEACRRVRAALPPHLQLRTRVVFGDYNCHQLKGVIGQCEFFVGSRMHACIAALSQGIPTVGIAYSRKFVGVFETVGMGDWVLDARGIGESEAVTRILELYRQRDAVRPKLKEQADRARDQLRETFARLFREIRSSNSAATTALATG